MPVRRSILLGNDERRPLIAKVWIEPIYSLARTSKIIGEEFGLELEETDRYDEFPACWTVDDELKVSLLGYPDDGVDVVNHVHKYQLIVLFCPKLEKADAKQYVFSGMLAKMVAALTGLSAEPIYGGIWKRDGEVDYPLK